MLGSCPTAAMMAAAALDPAVLPPTSPGPVRAVKSSAGYRVDQNLARTPSATSSGLRSIIASPYRRSK